MNICRRDWKIFNNKKNQTNLISDSFLPMQLQAATQSEVVLVVSKDCYGTHLADFTGRKASLSSDFRKLNLISAKLT